MCDLPNCILYLLSRPGEPVYMPKGKQKITFELPEEYVPERYREAAAEFSRNAVNRIQIKALPTLPDLSLPLKLKRNEPFSVFIPHHSELAGKLIDIFLGTRTYPELLSVASYARDRVNIQMYVYALSVAILHHPETRTLTPVSISQIFPSKFMPGATLKKAVREAELSEPGSRKCINLEKNHTASDLEPEHRVAYFREDLGVNLHHAHWHLIYPDNITFENVVNKHRRGELFYYMHQQIIARYNFERLSNNLGHVRPLGDLREPIPEGYFSKLGADLLSGHYPGRQDYTTLRDISISSGAFQILDLEQWRGRIMDSIHAGTIVVPGQKPDEPKPKLDIDILGNIVEANILSPNRTFYGDFHNNAHLAIAHAHDPDNRHKEGSNVMGENTTAMRDPVFYRLHAYVNKIFQEHKKTLPPYTKDELDYKSIKISNVDIKDMDGTSTQFQTHWQRSKVCIAHGLDFMSGGPVPVGFTHLNHKPFTYEITVENSSDVTKSGTVRIFMAPKYNESSELFANNLREQRHFMIELDKWVVKLHPGFNSIERQSKQSTVTIPFEQTFPDIKEDQSNMARIETGRSGFCSCGWPQHMLIPMGSKGRGMEVEVFVMISNYDLDKVDVEESTEKACCKEAMSYCGLKDKKYPDARAMGYPFDRDISKDSNSWYNFMTPNMHVFNTTIVFDDNIIAPDHCAMLET